MNRISKSCLALAAMVFASLASSPTVQADWFEDFNGSTLQNGWFFSSTTAGGTQSATFSPNDQANNYPDAIVNNQLQMSDTLAVAAGGAANGFGVVPSDSFADLRLTGTVNPNGNANSSDTAALIARGNIAAGQFYAAEVSFEDNKLIIFRNDNLAGSVTDLNEVTIPGLVNTSSVYLDFLLVGSSLSVDAYDSQGGMLLGSVTANDSTYSMGVSGVLGFFANDVNKPLLAEFDNLSSVSVVPEPSSMILLLIGVSGCVARRRRYA